MMPHMDGYEVARRMRSHANPSIANVPIIILTAKAETEDKLRGFEAGADDYITKPFGSASCSRGFAPRFGASRSIPRFLL